MTRAEGPPPGARRRAHADDGPRTARELRLARAGKRRPAARPPPTRSARGCAWSACPTRRCFVLFGATGDLAHRKVMPALYQLWRTNLLPHEFAIVGIGRRPYDGRGVPGRAAGLARRSSAASCRSRRPPGSPFAERITYYQRRLRRPGRCTTRSRRALDEIDRSAGPRGNRLFYLATQPSAFAEIIGQLGRAGLDHELHGGGWRRIVIEKPFGRDLASRDPPQPRGRQGLPRVAGLPHRPLPGQGDRPEHPGLPLRQRDLRADLEPPLRRPRADHGRRVDRGRGARRASTRRPAPRATSSRTT